MARKGTELRTDFTGEDSQLNQVHARQQRNAKEFGEEWKRAAAKAEKGTDKLGRSLNDTGKKADKAAGKMKKVAGAAGLAAGAMVGVTKQTSDLVDKLILAQRADIDFEQFQALSEVFKDFRIDADDTSELMLELSRAIGEVKQEAGEGTKTNVFKELGIDFETFEKLDPINRVLALSAAMSRLEDKDRALANLGQLLGDDLSIRFKPVLEQGERKLQSQISSVPIVSEAEAVKAQDQERKARRAAAEGKTFLSKGINLLLGRSSVDEFQRETAGAVSDGLKGVIIPPEFKEEIEEAFKEGTEPALRNVGNSAKGGGKINISDPSLIELLGIRSDRAAARKKGVGGLDALEALQRGGGARPDFPMLDAHAAIQSQQPPTAQLQREELKVGQELVRTTRALQQMFESQL